MRGSRGSAAAGVVALAVALGLATTPPPATAAVSVTVGTGDGLEMTLSPKGAVSSLRVGGREVSGGSAAPLFSVRKVGGMPNLLTNPGLEADRDRNGIPDGWKLMSGKYPGRWVTDYRHGGKRSVRFRVPEKATTATLQASTTVQPNTFYKLDAWMRSARIRPTAASAEPATSLSPVRVKVQQMGAGGVVHTDQAFGYTDTASWHRKYVGFRTAPGVHSVRVVAHVVAGTGTVWFDDFTLSELMRPAWGQGTGETVPTQGGARFTGVANNMGVDARVQAGDGHVRIEGTVSSPTDKEMPFQLRVSLPVQAAGWTWWDDPRRSREIQPGQQYSALTEWNQQQTSRYPIGTVSDETSALTLGLPLDRPKLGRVEYSAGRLHYTLDLGVAPQTSVHGGANVPFSLVLFTSEPDWGYRAALDKYAGIFPDHFRRRTDPAREGGWVSQFSRSRAADSWRDFGLGLNMIALGAGNDGGDASWGKDWMLWDNERGIYATAYNHHWGYKHPNVDDPTVPTYEVEMGRLRADSRISPRDYAESRLRDRSIASLSSGARDNNGRYLYARYKGYLQHYENLYPLTGALDWHEVSRTYQMQKSVDEAAAAGGTLDALHLDSVSGMRRWGAADDYHKPHWANATHGLTFSYDSGRVVDRLAFGVAAQVAHVAEYAHDRGMFLSANFNSSDARAAGWFGAHAIDYIGLERGLPEKAGAPNDPYTTVDRFALFKRAMAGEKPMSTIDPDCAHYSGQEVERRFHQTLLYGIYTGCGGVGSWAEEQRVVFARFTPLLREVNTAGWEAVTRARPSDDAVLIERFGSVGDDGAVFLVVHNPTADVRDVTVTVEDGVLDGTPAADLAAEDRISGSSVPVSPSAGGLSFERTLQPETSALVRLSPAG